MPRVGYTHSEETRSKMSANHWDCSGKNHPMWGKHHCEETRKRLRENNLGKASPFKGKKHTPESLEKMRLSKRGKPRVMTEKVYEGLKRGAEKKRGTTIPKEQREKISKTIHEKLPEYRHKLIAAWADPEKREKRILENNPNWQGGISYEPYCPKFNNKFKERVRAFFDYKCVECGQPQNGVRLSVHHVTYDKKTCCNNELPLFVALCHTCHIKTNKNREYWKNHFTNIINSKYSGQCYLPKQMEVK